MTDLLREARDDLKQHRHAGGEPDYCATCERIERIDAFLSQPEPISAEEDFETWWRRHHPFDWFAKECGSPLPAQYRLSTWAWAKDNISPLLDLSRREKA